MRIAKSLIRFGATYGNQDLKSIIKHRTTLKREYIPKIVEEKRTDIATQVNAAPQFPFFAFTSDMWTEKYKQKSFLSLSIHYINKDWQLMTHMLGVDQFIDDHKTTINIREQSRNILSKYFDHGVEDIMKNSSIVTDSGSNMIQVLQNRQPCQCHRLNTCVEWIFNKKPVPTEKQIADAEKQGRIIPQKNSLSLKRGAQRCRYRGRNTRYP